MLSASQKGDKAWVRLWNLPRQMASPHIFAGGRSPNPSRSQIRKKIKILSPASFSLENRMIPIKARPMASVVFQEIKNSLRKLYLDDARPWLFGLGGGKDRAKRC